MRLLVTRPEPDGDRTAALLRSRGHEVVVVPLFRIEAITDADLGAGPWAAVVFTSANAVQAIRQHPRIGEIIALRAYVVGARTQFAAATAGFAPVLSGDGNVRDLVRLIAANVPKNGLPLLYLAGRERVGDLAEALLEHGKVVKTAVIYRTVPAPGAAEQIGALVKAGQIDAVLHYSARTAAAFVTAVSAAAIPDIAFSIRHLCLSAEVAKPLLAAGATAVAIADRPTEEALLRRIGA